MDGIIKYKNIAIRAQLEQTKSGGLHYQAWIYTASNYRTSSLRKRIGEYWYKLLKDSDGNVATNEGGARRFWSDYCEKVESRVGPDYIHYNEKWTELCNLSYGDMPRIIRRKGERKDIDNIFAEARRMCLDTDKSAREIRQELATRFPNEYGKYTQGVDKVIELFFKETIYDVPETPWAWQRELIERCEGVPDRRKVLFVVDTKGDVGKSIAVKFLQQKFPGGVLSMDGEIRDMAHLVATHCREMKIAICDIARPTGPGKWEKILELFENVSNGGLFSGKYVPIACTFKKPHIVIFTNKLPTYLPDLISNDRIEIWVPSAAQPYGSGKPTFKFYGKDGFDAYVKKYQ